jgi:predicted transcriptional regulator
MQDNSRVKRRVPVAMAIGAVINYAALALFAAKANLVLVVSMLLLLGTATMFIGAYRGRDKRERLASRKRSGVQTS